MTLRPLFSTMAMTVLTLATATACGDDAGDGDSGPGDGGVDVDIFVDTGPCTECTELAFQVELETASGSLALEDGLVVVWEWGFQGGTMIRPRIFFDEGDVEVDQIVRIELTHSPDPSAPEAFGDVADFQGLRQDLRVRRDDDGRLTIVIDDQIGWDALDGTRLVLSVQVQADQARGTRSGAITLMMPPSPCDAFEQLGDGCMYYQIPGSAVVSLSSSEGSCTDAQRVDLTFTADDTEMANACATSRGVAFRDNYTFTLASGEDPPQQCLEGLGLTEGATVRGVAQLIAVGGCSPTGFELVDDDGSCTELCHP